MKKLRVLSLIAAVTITFSSCGTTVKGTLNNTTKTQEPIQTEKQIKAIPDPNLLEGPMKLAYEGKIDNLQAGIGARVKEIISELGEPLELAHFEGSTYLSYQNMNFILDRIIEKTSQDATVVGISIFEGYELYGVKVGMTPDEIKKVLGAPAQEYREDDDGAGMWKLEYNCGDYSLTFFCDNQNSATTAAYLSKI